MELSAGPGTDLLTSAAGAIGSGVITDGFLGGLIGLVLRRERSTVEDVAFHFGYGGGLLAVILWLVEQW